MQPVAGMTDVVIWAVERLLSQTTNDLERQTGIWTENSQEY